MARKLLILSGIFLFLTSCINKKKQELQINDSGYFEKQGLNILVFSNWYNNNFDDSKMSGIEIIHHEVRTVTNGDVRLHPTPGQWDPYPKLIDRKIVKDSNRIEAYLSYPQYNYDFVIKAYTKEGGFYLSVHSDKPLPSELEGYAGFNLEFLPSAYQKKSFKMDDKSGIFPLYPSGPMEIKEDGVVEPLPIASGKSIVFAPEDPLRRITVKSENELLLYDGRNKAQNGWYVLRSLIPSGKTGKLVEWFVSAGTVQNWKRPPMISYSQVGYHPDQKKTAVIELDRNDNHARQARLLKVMEDGNFEEKMKGSVKKWGNYLRYIYYTFDFSKINEEGTYVIEYNNITTGPFIVSKSVYEKAWQPTLDVFFPVQMDHMLVNEAYRVWHGASHLDDALQAPVNHVHFDLYAQKSTTDSPYKPGEHIPGLNIGGWFDAGDFDIRTQTHYATVINLVQIWETFGLKRDETTINQKHKYVDIHVPDGYPDLLQQIEHGTLALIVQHRSVGHAISGIVDAHLSQYHHLGDAVTQTDNLVYDKNLDSLETDGYTSGTFDDRWAFTNHTTALNYGSAAALAAASRTLKGYNDKLSEECLTTAIKVWNEEQNSIPDTFFFGNTTGGNLKEEELKAAVELFISTKNPVYSEKINNLISEMKFNRSGDLLLRVLPFMDKEYKTKIKDLVISYKSEIDSLYSKNPFGVPITTGGWAGNGAVIRFSIMNYMIHKTFPEIMDPEYVFRGLNYIYGCHPGSNISFVSAVGVHSKMVAYGNNRADFSFIAGGIVPGVLVLPPDFPENKEDWPFLWGENEYVINMGSIYIYLVNAVNDLLNNES